MAVDLTQTRANRLKLNLDKLEGPLIDLGTVCLVLMVSHSPEGTGAKSWCAVGPVFSIESQILAVAKNSFYKMRRIAHLHLYLNRKCFTALVHVLVMSKIDY